jgi:hypothetical protein
MFTTDFHPSIDLGPTPRLEWISVVALVSDPAYQRRIDTLRSGRLIRDIAEHFSWHRFKAPTVADRGDGTFAIIDGQHTVEGARLHGGIPSLPCLIVATDQRGEADGFAVCNERRIKVNEFQLFHAKRLAGDPDALQVAAIIQSANVTIPRYPVPADKLPPRATLAVCAIDAAMRKHGDGPVVQALRLLADAHPETGGQLRAPVIRALIDLIVQARRDNVEVDEGRITRVLSDRMAEELIEAARADRKLNRRPTEDNIRARLVAAYNNRLAEERRLPAPF